LLELAGDLARERAGVPAEEVEDRAADGVRGVARDLDALALESGVLRGLLGRRELRVGHVSGSPRAGDRRARAAALHRCDRDASARRADEEMHVIVATDHLEERLACTEVATAQVPRRGESGAVDVHARDIEFAHPIRSVAGMSAPPLRAAGCR